MTRFSPARRGLWLAVLSAPPHPPGELLNRPQSDLLRDLDRVVQLGNAITSALLHLVEIAVHEVVLLSGLVIAAAALAGSIIWLAAKLGLPRRRRQIFPIRPVSLRVRPPIEGRYEPEAWMSFFRALYVIAAPWWKRWLIGQPWITFEFRAEAGRVACHCWCPEDLAGLASASLRNALPGVDLVPDPEPEPLGSDPAARARLKLWKESLYPLAAARTDSLAAALAALTTAPTGVIQLSLAPDVGWERRAWRRIAQLSGGKPQGNLLLKLLSLPLDLIFELFWSYPETTRGSQSTPMSRSTAPPPTEKAGQACWRAEIRICTWAPQGTLARQAVRPVLGAFQALDGENRLRPRRVWWPRSFDRALAERTGPLGSDLVLSPAELAQLCHLPVAGVLMDTAPVRLAPSHPLGQEGSLLCRLEDEDRTPIHIAQPDRRLHLHVVGPTGSGKSTLLLNLALQDIEAGVGVGVLDPKGDLVSDLLERLPSRHLERLVLFDAAERERPLGLNVLDCEDEAQRELVTDGVVAIFRKSYERFWGPRTDDLLRASLLTLLREPGVTLCEVPLLLLNQGVRARLTRRLDDPIGLRLFWQEYEGWSEGQRLQMVGPVLNKLRAFLLRPTVRNVLGQSLSTIDLGHLMDQGGILLVNLSKGALGEETSRLLGAFVVSRIWQTALRRSARPESWRPDFNLYLDEFQDYLHLPQSIDDVLAEARSYRLNLTLAHQHLDQLRDSTRQAVEANARTRVVFQASQDDARHLARQFSPLSDQHLQSLAQHQVAVRLCVEGHTEPPFTAISEGPPPSLGEEHRLGLARASLARWGRPRTEVEAEIAQRMLRLGFRGDFKEIA